MNKLARLPAEIASKSARAGLALAARAIGVARGLRPGDGDAPPPPVPAPTPRPARTPEPAAAPRPAPREQAPRRARAATASAVPQSAPTGPPPVPDLPVSREAVEVASFGPADDPGASISVKAPWDDYDRLPAAEVVSRVRAADAATAAAVALYERRHKARRTVLTAAGRSH